MQCLLGFAACGGDDEGYDEGYSAGYEAGLAANSGSGYDEGYNAGYGDGYDANAGSGFGDGYNSGYSDAGVLAGVTSSALGEEYRHNAGGYANEAAVVEAGEKMNAELASESITLLKNKNDNALPLASNAKVSVLGIAQDCLVETSGNITQSLSDAGFSVNTQLETYYLGDSYSADDVSGQLLATAPYGDESEYLTSDEHATLEGSMSGSDAIIVVLARGTGGESSDRSTNTGEAEDDEYLGEDTGWTHEAQETEDGAAQKHELELTASEQELLKEAESVTGAKVIVLYSSSNTFEMANLEDDDNIDAILWMGRMGDGGIDAVGKILSGEVNPSGKTVDEWTRDFTNDPTYANTTVTAYNDEDGNSLRVTMGSTIMDQMYEAMMPGALDLGSIDYEEDIYLGYKWYETYWAEASKTGSELVPTIEGQTGTITADQWYDYNVVYPYGYGLSYTDFGYELTSLTADDQSNTNLMTEGASLGATDIFNSANANGAKTITAKVKVTNTGSVAGKETVEVYVEAPYTAGGVEKPYYTLVGFGKTDTLDAGASETLEITFNIQDFASFDYSDANENGSNVYELDPGSYTVHVMGSSSHENIATDDGQHSDAYESATFSISDETNGAVVMDLDDYSENPVEAWFSGDDSSDGSNAWKDDYYSNYAGGGFLLSPRIRRLQIF